MVRGKFNKNLVIATITIAVIATALTIAPTVPSNTVEAAAGSRVQGTGSGSVTCPPNSDVVGSHPGQVNFDATKSKGNLFGSFGVSTPPGEAGGKSGDISGGSINGQRYSLTGIESFDSMCFPDDTFEPTTVYIKGNCGAGATIKLTTDIGETGTFTGNVGCVQ